MRSQKNTLIKSIMRPRVLAAKRIWLAHILQAKLVSVWCTSLTANSTQVIPDLLADRVQASFVPLAFVLGQVREGKLLALAVTSHNGIEVPVKAPSVSEAAIPGYEYNTWFGFVAPSKVPQPILDRLAKALQTAANMAEVKETLSRVGIFPRTLISHEFDDYIKADVAKEKGIASEAGIEPR